MGIKDYKLLYRSQDERGDPENSPQFGVYLWQDDVNDLYWFSQQPVQDLSDDTEWEEAGIIGCSTIDLKTVWIPWDAKEPSSVQISFAMFYEKEMRVRAEAKLSQWQVWWQANGRNAFCEVPPQVPPPPPLAAGPPAAHQVPSTNLIRQLQRQRVALGPKPPPFPPPHMATATAEAGAEGSASTGTEASAAGTEAATAKAPATMMPPPPPRVPVAPPTGKAAASPANPKAVPISVNPTVEVNTGWKGKMCALIGAMEMGLQTRVQYLAQKFLVKHLCKQKQRAFVGYNYICMLQKKPCWLQYVVKFCML